ncbi:MAG: hypothetical protein MUO64_01765 [Anaerolineales bacterium]|nr:hypothetical protein [Anaerolineales bacterium]
MPRVVIACSKKGQVPIMNKTVKRVLYWAPRILSILFAIFVGLFALDLFGAGYSFWETILALLIHLIPTFAILIVLAISWRWEWVGGVLFIFLAAFYLVRFGGQFPWSIYLVMSGPPFLVGILFIINWFYRKDLRV